MHRTRVQLGERSYDVVVGRGSLRELAGLVPADAKRVAIVTQNGVPVDVAPHLPTHVATSRHIVGESEDDKSLATIERLCEEFASVGLTRQDLVLGVGGGMVTDIAGFAAASWHRGVRVAHVSTTLVGMIDAAIGGKTGVNLRSGKNLVGAFWQPCGVVCDTALLDSLPEREQRCGRGEMAKYHFLTGDDLLALDLDERVARCVQIKADIVGNDERESGRRAVLNYGHTLGHALEIATDFALAHGEAVAVGMMFAAHLARALGRIDDARVELHRRVIQQHYGLSVSVPSGIDRQRLVDLMHSDKKAIDGLTFVLDGPRGIEVVRGVEASALEAAFTAVSVP
ncbi:MAG: 3-dehydroquinate synthase family protein [Ilumatobacteraceae bacterium]|jgi:5-deoxy-5-amino-3-dehydroquinate synthase